jgi:tRNA G37 N-methylase Trm5
VVKESGRHIICDPTRAYYSTKLQTERLETLAYAKELRKEIGEPLRVCDPFCGVGPALACLIGVDGLIGDILAADLNPDAAEIMIENFSKWDRTEYEFTGELKRYSETRLLGVGDATRLSENENLIGNWNLILMNLPHRTIDFLPNIVPLLDRSKVSMIRGRVVVKESEIAEANASIVAALPPLLENKPLPELRIKRDYSASLRLCSFEAWIAPMD